MTESSGSRQEFALPGVRVWPLTRWFDERGFFMQAFRADWRELLGDDVVVQANVSLTYPDVVRAWHRHARGQVDYFLVLQGGLRICAYDDEPESPTRGQLVEIVVHAAQPQIVRVPGFYWHGVRCITPEPALLVYLVTRLYDPVQPDEQRRPWNDPSILDPRTGRPYDWFRPPHR